VTDSSADPLLSEAETQAAEASLAHAWGERTEVRAAERIWRGDHVLRLRLEGDRSAVLKRRLGADEGDRSRFGLELTVLEYLNAMPVPVAPRLLGADVEAGIMLMEDLGPGPSLAGALLTGERERAQAGLIAYARALASMHAWSIGRRAELADLQARYAPGADAGPAWMRAVRRRKDPFLGAATTLGLAVDGVEDEMGEVTDLLSETGYLGLVHGDACPDNTRLADGTCRIFDFEVSGWGPVVLDAAYLVAPFPSCWCFANLPGEVGTPAIDAYRACLEAAGIDLGTDWDAAMTAALAGWIVARGWMIVKSLEEDDRWGTTTMRPRLLEWLRNFVAAAGGTGILLRLRALARAMHDELAARWPEARVPDYPALARPGSVLAEVPEEWRPGM
jgi:Ser/Thr protein kinase RdoA (MazF antagonist)